MKDVGVREFRDHASSYLSGDEPLAVRRHAAVPDTNTFVSALPNIFEAPGKVLYLVLAGELPVAHDDRLPAEWRQVGEYGRNAKRAECEASGTGANGQELIQ